MSEVAKKKGTELSTDLMAICLPLRDKEPRLMLMN